MDNEKLQALVEEISLKFFGIPFTHQATFNYRLKTTGGRYLLGTSNIEINPKQYEVFGEKELISIIKHELCHYHLHRQGKGYMHKDVDFKILLKKVGGSRFCRSLGNKKKQKAKHQYICTQCQYSYLRVRRIDVERYVCGKCGGKIKNQKEG